MIRKLENGSTLIELGKGTVHVGNIKVKGEEKPFGIAFSNDKNLNKLENLIIFQITSNEAIASYIMALVYLIEELNDHEDTQIKEVSEAIESLKKNCHPI